MVRATERRRKRIAKSSTGVRKSMPGVALEPVDEQIVSESSEGSDMDNEELLACRPKGLSLSMTYQYRRLHRQMPELYN